MKTYFLNYEVSSLNFFFTVDNSVDNILLLGTLISFDNVLHRVF